MIRVNNLSFYYQNEPIITSASFTVDRGDFVCIAGANGAGKSTLLKLMLGLLPPTGGQIIKASKAHSYVSQTATAFNPGFPGTVEEVVGLGLYGADIPRGQSKKNLTASALAQTDMEKYRGQLMGRLSGGQQQRVFIAKALINKPDIIYLDEPTSGVDRDSVGSICCLLGELNKNAGITILMVTHDVHSILDHANKILHFSQGGGVAMMNPKDYLPIMGVTKDKEGCCGDI